MHEFFASAPKGVSALLAEELKALGAQSPVESAGGVHFRGTLETAYRALLWSRTASRILLIVGKFPAFDSDSLYEGVKSVNWADHMSKASTMAVDAVTMETSISNSHFAALRVKDAVCDQFRDKFRVRPTVELIRPRVRLNLYLSQDQGVMSIDLAGEGLHKRGYREEGGEAPLKENLAAAILMALGWPGLAAEGASLVDPMAGSGTFLVEGALMATDTAPGLLREYYAAFGWKGHDQGLWDMLRAEALERASKGRERLGPMVGCDISPRAARSASGNIIRAGFADLIRVRARDFSELRPPENPRSDKGLLVVNPPYGERMGEESELASLHARLGELLRAHFPGFSAGVFTGNPTLGRFLGITAHKQEDLYNGPIPCKLLHLKIAEANFFEPPAPETFVPRVREPEAEFRPRRDFSGEPERDRRDDHRPGRVRETGDTPYRPRRDFGDKKPWEKKSFGPPREGDDRGRDRDSSAPRRDFGDKKPWEKKSFGPPREGDDRGRDRDSSAPRR
ncbi:MAG: hypothetical protein HZB23_15360, partial [Deltaproteobacteria bacterium]|nr:hypothetical protein [Deltaproteobacteria bacterium]